MISDKRNSGFNMGRNIITLMYGVKLFLACNSWNINEDPTLNFESFEVIHPKVVEEGTRSKRDLNAYQEENSKLDHVKIEFQAFKRAFHLQLVKNKKLFSPHYQEIHQEKGRHVRSNVLESRNHCYYTGTLEGHEESWASINICLGLNGIVSDGTESFHLHYYENVSGIVNIALKASDMKSQNYSCGNKNLEPQGNLTDNYALNRFRRSSAWYFPYKEKKRFVELFVVADRSMFQKYKNRENVSKRVADILNVVHGMYLQLDVFIVLVGIRYWNYRDEISVSSQAGKTLNDFSNYGDKKLREYQSDSIHLITDVNFEGPTVGLAFRGTMCKASKSVGINQDASTLASSVAVTLAHEIGHNFNMTHDEANCRCAEKACIMAGSSSGYASRWSSCSAAALHKYLSDGMDSCLRNMPKQTDLPSCGNGVIEDLEQCDCGLPHICDNPCCNAVTCQLVENATCASGGCCDSQTCKIKQMSVTCREHQSECDLPEYCDGQSAMCPDDVFVQDGTECGNGKAFCHEGSCRSHNDQCSVLMGPDTKSAAPSSCCYQFNTVGTQRENCGSDPSKKIFHKCNEEDTYCGTLKCISAFDQNPTLIYVRPAGSMSSRTCLDKGKPRYSKCYYVHTDLNSQIVDPGLVPNGARCGENMMCLNQKCVPVRIVKKHECPKNCSENGVCNTKGNCHCIIGFGPPACDSPGPGGSLNSGPPSDPEAGSNYVVSMYVIFFCVYPLSLITAAIVYLFEHEGQESTFAGKRTANQTDRRKRPSFMDSLKRLPRRSLQSVSDDVPYNFISSDQDPIRTPTTVRVIPQIPESHRAVSAQMKNKRPQLPLRIPAHLERKQSDSAGSSTRPLPLNRNASQRSLHEGVILKVPNPKAHAKFKNNPKIVDRKAPSISNDEGQTTQGVAKLAKLFENKS